MPIALPKDGAIVTDDSGHSWVFYQIGQWVLTFDLGEDLSQYDTTGMETASRYYNGIDLLGLPTVIGGGKLDTLNTIATAGFGTMKAFVDRAFGILGAPGAKDDKELQRVALEFIRRPDMSSTELQYLVSQTNWYKTRNATQRKWNDLGPADQDAAVEDTKEQLRQSWLDTFGSYPEDADIAQAARDIASGQINYGAVLDGWRRKAAGDPESPWSRTLRNEQENRLLRAQQITDMTGSLDDLAMKWGVRMTPDALKSWATDIVSRTKSEVDFENIVKDTAAALYPGKPRDLDTTSYAQSWMSSYMRILEKSDASLFNPTIQSAMQRNVNLADFERELRDSPEWMTTQNAMDTLTSSAARIGARLGFI